MVNKKNSYLDVNLKWSESDDPEYPFQTKYNGHNLQIRLNDFPEESLYSLIDNGEAICDFDDWPEAWGEEP